MDYIPIIARAVACEKDIPQDVANRRMFAWCSTTIVLALAVITFAARIWARIKSYQRLGLDDYLMGIGLLITLEPAICEYMLMANGLGHHICNVPISQRERFLRISFALQRANQPALVCIKSSILVFYMRLFPARKFQYFAWANIAYTVIWGIISWCVNLTVCTPVAYYYDKSIVGGNCKNQNISGIANGGVSLLGDVFILALPLPMVWGLQINLRRRVALLGIFMLGGIVCVSSAIRLSALYHFTPTDGTYTQVYASGWTFMEMGFAVISGNLPLLRPLFERFFRIRTGKTGKSSGSRPTYGVNSVANMNTKGRRGVSQVDAEGFERISDDGSSVKNLRPGVSRDIELGDRGILVKKDVTIVKEEKFDTDSVGSDRKYFANVA